MLVLCNGKFELCLRQTGHKSILFRTYHVINSVFHEINGRKAAGVIANERRLRSHSFVQLNGNCVMRCSIENNN